MPTKKSKTKPAQVARGNLFLLRMVWQEAKGFVLWTFALNLLNFGSWVFETVVFMRYLFGAAEMTHTFQQVAIFLGCAMAFWLVLYALDAWFYQRYRLKNDPILYQRLHRRLFAKACNVDLACYENAEFYNSYTKASNEIFTRGIAVVENLSTLLASTLSSIYVIVVMFSINIWAGLISLLPVISNLLLGSRINQMGFDRSMDMVPDQRKQGYVNRVFYLSQYAKEIRLTGVFGVLAGMYYDAMGGILRVSDRYWKRLFALTTVKNSINFPVLFEGTWMLGAFLAMVVKVVTVSDFVVMANAAVSTTWMLVNLTDALNGTLQNALYADNLRRFLDYEEAISEDQPGLPAPKRVESLALRGVSFRYSPEGPMVLQDINMTLHAGEIVSLVGHNGSGKSTLVKLLMRLYDPTEGQILLNGVDIRDYCLRDYRALIGTTFQDFQIFSLSVADNVVMGNPIAGDEEEMVEKSLRRSGAYERISSLPDGVDTTLTREFDDNGANLSGGEQQKVAVARAFAKKSAILLLDEPSSALDPVAEYRLMQSFVAHCRDNSEGEKISIFISHRLSSSTVADRIYRLEGGCIAEQGTHEELMKRRGGYAAMFDKQAEHYLWEK